MQWSLLSKSHSAQNASIVLELILPHIILCIFFVSDRIELGNIANLMLKLEMHGLDKKMAWKKILQMSWDLGIPA